MKSKSIQGRNKERSGKRNRMGAFCLAASCSVLFLALLPGCGNKFWDPAQVGRFRPVPSVSVILDSLGVAEETPVAWEHAEEPRPADTVVMETDYVFSSGDAVLVSIFELQQEGLTDIKTYIVTETGKISIPDVGVIEAGGLTETQLEEEIRQILSPSILKDPSVVVTLVASQQRTFSILGDGIPAPGRYVIPRYGFKLTDALATAGGQRQFNVGFIYIARTVDNGAGSVLPELFGPGLQMELLTPEPEATAPSAGPLGGGSPVPELFGPGFETELLVPESEVTMPELTIPEVGVSEGSGEDAMLKIIAPYSQNRRWPVSSVVIASAELGTLGELGRPNVSTSFGGAGAVDSSLSFEPEPQGQTAASGAFEMWDKPEENKEVTVSDILKTLAEQSRQKSAAVGATGAQRVTPPMQTPRPGAMTSYGNDLAARDVLMGGQKSGRTYGLIESPPSVAEEPSGIDAIMRTLSDRSRPKAGARGSIDLTGQAPLVTPRPQVDNKGTYEPVGVDDILKALEEKPGAELSKGGADWGQTLEAVAEPGPRQETGDELMDLDELLKSFAEPGAGEKTDEQIGVRDVDLGMDPGLDLGVERGLDLGVDTRVEPDVEPEFDLGLDLGLGSTRVAPSPVEPGGGVGEEPGRIEWVFQGGKWVPMQVGTPSVPAPPVIRVEPQGWVAGPAEEQPSGGLEWTSGAKTRLIKIPADRLMAGDPRYNIVIKAGDSIFVPVDVIGEFYVMGNVNRQGPLPITGRPLTLKMAIAAAGGLGPLAYPKRCEVTRRISRKKEETVMVDLDKISRGEQPDFFIKPNDLINVGTHATSRWRAVLRNAFRATYGFGFVYDRNFALDNYYNSYGQTQRIDIDQAFKIF